MCYCSYTGKLYTPQESVPANMIVRFPLSTKPEHSLIPILILTCSSDIIGSASFVVLDTDYDNYGLLCTCQVGHLMTS